MTEAPDVGQTESADSSFAHLRAFSQILGYNPLLSPSVGDASGPEYNIHVAFLPAIREVPSRKTQGAFSHEQLRVSQSPFALPALL